MSPIEEPKEPIFWLPFTRDQVSWLQSHVGELAVDYCNMRAIVELAIQKISCADILLEIASRPPRMRVSPNLSLDDLEIEL